MSDKEARLVDASEASLRAVSQPTSIKKRIWLKGRKEELDVCRIPIKYLYFNIQNGRYADKMVQLRADNAGADIDPRKDQWKKEILCMLSGTYHGGARCAGTEKDKAAFERLRDDLKARTQLEPGVVLADGGVIDGNRRLAVLMTLYAGEHGNPERYAYFEGVILPEDVDAEDRWKIEAGVQLGKNQQLDYSPMNKLLKIREGYELFKSSRLPPGTKPERLVAETLYGISLEEVNEAISRTNLIDQYLDFFGESRQYHTISNKSERFAEALKTITAAQSQGLPPEKIKTLTIAQFMIIRGDLMDNWQMREINRALGGNMKGRGRKTKPIQKAIDHLLTNTPDIKELQTAIKDKKVSGIIDKFKDVPDDFLKMVEGAKEGDKPLRLARGSRINLETLQDFLSSTKEELEEKGKIEDELNKSKSTAEKCIVILKKAGTA